MKKNTLKKISPFRAFAVMTIIVSLPFGAKADEHSLNLGARYHTAHHNFDKSPFGNGDISYLLAYTYAEKIAAWQLGVDFAPDISGTMLMAGERVIGREEIDYVVTPQLNLIFIDRCFRGGVGVKTSYIRAEEENFWLDPYWQFLLGINIPLLKRFDLDLSTSYVFQRWDYLDKFDFRDLEYLLSLNIKF